MSVSSLTTLSAVRKVTLPTKRDLGKVSRSDLGRAEEGKEKPSYIDLLVTAVPTELVAPYTAVSAAIVGAIDDSTKKVPAPDEFELWRWLIFLALVFATGFAVWFGDKRKSAGVNKKKLPARAVAVAVVAAAGWALALPNSPIIPLLDGDEKIFAPMVAAFLAVAGIVGLGGKLRQEAD